MRTDNSAGDTWGRSSVWDINSKRTRIGIRYASSNRISRGATNNVFKRAHKCGRTVLRDVIGISVSDNISNSISGSISVRASFGVRRKAHINTCMSARKRGSVNTRSTINGGVSVCV